MPCCKNGELKQLTPYYYIFHSSKSTLLDHLPMQFIDVISVTFDDKLTSTNTDENGRFTVTGSGASTIDPHLKIYHDCNDGWTPCQVNWSMVYVNGAADLNVNLWPTDEQA